MSHLSVLRVSGSVFRVFVQYKNRYLVVSKQIIHYLCEGGLEKSGPRDNCLSSLGKPSDAISDARDGFFYPTLTLMTYSFTLKFQT